MTERDSNPLAVRVLYGAYKGIVSPVLHTLSPTQCLYRPTCSEYAYVALHRFGPWKGSWLALRRFLRCHPFAKGGFDPVPDLDDLTSSKIVENHPPAGDSNRPGSVSHRGNHLP